MEHEEAFAEEALQEALLSRTTSIEPNSHRRSNVHPRFRTEDDLENENSPLITAGEPQPSRKPYTRAGASYERAVNEPWTGAYGSAELPWYRRPSILWLLPAFFPFCLAFGGVIVPKTYLILDLVCQDYLSDRAAKDPTFKFMPVVVGIENPQCRVPEVQSLVARFNLYQSLLSGIFSAIVTPHLGALSDRIGRKKVIVCASFGAFSMEIITIIVGLNAGQVSVYWILLGSLFDGLCGSFTTAMALAFAYAADCTAPERRNVAFGYFHGMMFSGIALGPILAGWLISRTGTVMVVFYVALGCHIFFILFVSLAAPESLSKERQMVATEKWREARLQTSNKGWIAAIRNYNFFQPLWVLRPTGPGSSHKLRRNLFVLAAIDTMMFGVAMGTLQILIIYSEYRFGWTPVDSSLYLSAVNVCRVTALVALLPLLTRIFRGPVQAQSSGHQGCDMLDINIIRGSVIFDLIGYIGYAFTPNGTFMVVSGMIASLGGIGSPTLQSSLTKHISADRTGQMLGASGLLHSLARVVAPVVFNLIYSATVAINPGIVFMCLASVFVVVFVFSWFLKPNVYLNESSSVNDDTDPSNVTG